MSIANIINKFLNVKPYEIDKTGVWQPKKKKEETLTQYDDFNKLVAMGNIETLYTSSKPFVIEKFWWGTSGATAKSNLEVLLAVGAANISNNYLGQVLKVYRGTGRGYGTASNMGTDGSDFFDISEFDDTNNRYAFMWKEAFLLPEGGTVGFRNRSTTEDANVHYKLLIRELE